MSKRSYDLEEWKKTFNEAIKYERGDKDMSINSRNKGKVGELEFVKKIKEYGFTDARRTQQFSGEGHTADVIGLPDIHIEVKRVESLNIHNAIAQCHRDKRESDLGIVAHRKNNTPWLVTMTLDDWMEIYKRYLLTKE